MITFSQFIAEAKDKSAEEAHIEVLKKTSATKWVRGGRSWYTNEDDVRDFEKNTKTPIRCPKCHNEVNRRKFVYTKQYFSDEGKCRHCNAPLTIYKQ